MDDVALFLEECCVFESNLRTQARVLFDTYGQWAERGGRVPFNHREFGQRLARKGLQKKKSSSWYYLGVGISPDWDTWADETQTTGQIEIKESGIKPPMPPKAREHPPEMGQASTLPLAEAATEGGSR